MGWKVLMKCSKLYESTLNANKRLQKRKSTAENPSYFVTLDPFVERLRERLENAVSSRLLPR